MTKKQSIMFVKEAFAQIINPAIPPSLGNVTNVVSPVTGIGNLLGAIIAMFLIVGALAAFIFLALGALRWITSGGDKAKLEQGREEITNAIIGLVVLAAVWAIMTIVSTFLGLGIFTNTNGIFQLPILEALQGTTTNGAGNKYRISAVGGCEPNPNGTLTLTECLQQTGNTQPPAPPPTYTCVTDANYYRACGDCYTGLYREYNANLTCSTGVCCQQHK